MAISAIDPKYVLVMLVVESRVMFHQSECTKVLEMFERSML